MSYFTYDYGEMSVAKALKLNKKTKRIEYLKKTNIEKVLVYGVGLGIGVSMLYLLLTLTAYLTA